MTPTSRGRDGRRVVERFQPTSGRVRGVVGLVAAVVVAGARGHRRGDRHRRSAVAIAALLLAPCCVWVALLRPGVVGRPATTWCCATCCSTVTDAAGRDRARSRSRQMLAVCAGERALRLRRRSATRARQTRPGKARQRAESRGQPARSTRLDTHQAFVEERIAPRCAEDAATRLRHRPRLAASRPALAADVRRDLRVARDRRRWSSLALAFVVWLFASEPAQMPGGGLEVVAQRVEAAGRGDPGGVDAVLGRRTGTTTSR